MIRIRGVRKSFESQLVLDGVDLDIPERSVTSIIGQVDPENRLC